MRSIKNLTLKKIIWLIIISPLIIIQFILIPIAFISEALNTICIDVVEYIWNFEQTLFNKINQRK